MINSVNRAVIAELGPLSKMWLICTFFLLIPNFFKGLNERRQSSSTSLSFFLSMAYDFQINKWRQFFFPLFCQSSETTICQFLGSYELYNTHFISFSWSQRNSVFVLKLGTNWAIRYCFSGCTWFLFFVWFYIKLY